MPMLCWPLKLHSGFILGLQMGEVLGESARIALSWIRAHAPQLPLLPAGDLTAETAASSSDGAKADAADSTCWNVHLHLPAGAVPKVDVVPSVAL